MIPLLTGGLSFSFKLAELIFFPSFCPLCSSLLELTDEKVICHDCLESLKPQKSSYCYCCGRFFYDFSNLHLCGSCLEKRPPFSIHRSAAPYRGKLKDIILLFKYKGFRILGRDLAYFIYQAFKDDEAIWWGLDSIIPVPIHPRRKKIRGFNQVQIIAKELSRLSGIEIVEKCLIKTKNVPPQTSLDAKERRRNVRGAFEIKRSESIKGKIILLVDDVFTTGSTIYECSFVLKNAGAKEVRALSLAQACA